jgi:Domain of unknown function (DUF1906)/Putative peptidoglycan binding domain
MKLRRTLLLKQPRMRGTDVKDLQILLKQGGFKPGALDGVYGPSTVAAVLRAKQTIPGYLMPTWTKRAGRYFSLELTHYVDHVKPKPPPKSGKGIDYAWSHPRPAEIVKGGYSFVGRYLSWDKKKNLSAPEAKALREEGLDIVVVWESTADEALRGAAAGIADAKEARRQALAVGMPATTPIYFAIDFDAQPAQFPAVEAYFRAIQNTLGAAYVGAYGSFAVLKVLFDLRAIAYGWQTLAWSNGQWESRAQLRQTQENVTIDGVACDLDVAVATNFGAWSV